MDVVAKPSLTKFCWVPPTGYGNGIYHWLSSVDKLANESARFWEQIQLYNKSEYLRVFWNGPC